MKKCLVVDDSKVVRKFARNILEKLGFSVEEAGNGKEALKAVTKPDLFDVILLDWDMPVMDGITFAKKFFQQYTNTTTLIVFCTTENGVDRIQEALAAGASEYIIKPFDIATIRNKFSQLGLI